MWNKELPNSTTSRKFRCLNCSWLWFLPLYTPELRFCPMCGNKEEEKGG